MTTLSVAIGMTVVIAGLIIALASVAVFDLVNTSFPHQHKCQAVVTGKHFREAWTEYVNDTTISHSAHWEILVRTEQSGMSGITSVDPELGHLYEPGQLVTIWYYIGRLNRATYVTSITR